MRIHSQYGTHRTSYKFCEWTRELNPIVIVKIFHGFSHFVEKSLMTRARVPKFGLYRSTYSMVNLILTTHFNYILFL